MALDDDLNILAEQERLLRFVTFTADTAWAIGSALRADALRRNAAMSLEVQLAGRVLFHAVTGEAPPNQSDWIRRKRNTVLRWGRSSYAMGLELEKSGLTLEARHGLTLADFALHGGGFPLLWAEAGCVGSIVCSGLAQREDHAMVVDAIASVLQVNVPRLSFG